MRFSIVIVSWIYSLEILTLRLLCFAASKMSPKVKASSDFLSASYLSCFLLFNSVSFSSGGVPSKTQIGLMPTYIQCRARYIIPIKCPVWLPLESIGRLTLSLELALIILFFTDSFDEKFVNGWRTVNGQSLVLVVQWRTMIYYWRAFCLNKVHELNDSHSISTIIIKKFDEWF